MRGEWGVGPERRCRLAEALGAVGLVLLFLAGCASVPPGSGGAPVLSRIQEKGELVVGTAASMPPLNMTTKQGEIIGFEIDLARAMAEAMNVKLRLVPTPFPDLLPTLEAGKVDMVLSGLTITPQRNMKVAFVGPYFSSGKSFLTKEVTLASTKGSADLNNPSMRLAALRASTSQTFVQRFMPKATLVLTQDYDEAIDLLLQDKIDALIADYPVCVFSVYRYPDRGLFALLTPLSYEPIGIALPGDDPLLVNWTQNWLHELEVTGVLEATKARWFKDASWLDRLR
jgi:polar amino acid transport system substrate-binding protein